MEAWWGASSVVHCEREEVSATHERNVTPWARRRRAASTACTMLTIASLLWMTVSPAAGSTGVPRNVPIDHSRYAPYPADPVAVECPTVTECVAVGLGGAVVFNSRHPNRAHRIRLRSAGELTSLSCPAARQCTAVNGSNVEFTFDPKSGARRTPAAMRGYIADLVDVSCPTVNICDAVDTSGPAEVEFDPRMPRRQISARFGDIVRDSAVVSCPGAHQCTVLAFAGAVTFDPTAPRHRSLRRLPEALSYFSVICPSRDQCIAAGAANDQATFNPRSARMPVRRAALNVSSRSFSCPSATMCAGLDPAGGVLVFDPLRLQDDRYVPLGGPLSDGIGPQAVSCPSREQCTVVGADVEATFDPGA